MITCPKCKEMKSPDEMSNIKKNLGPDGWCNICVSKANGSHKMIPRVVKPTKKILERMYIEERMSSNEIAEKLGFYAVTVRRWLKTYEIPVRTISEARLKGVVKPLKKELERMYVNEEMNL